MGRQKKKKSECGIPENIKVTAFGTSGKPDVTMATMQCYQALHSAHSYIQFS
jgi:hypothetical protein